MFSQVGRRSAAPTDLRTRVFHLVIVLGLLVATLTFLVELANPPARLVTAEVDLTVKPSTETR